uniref:Uncharacterized protein n=1 Tax=Arundo donax TaxID=35708 RepID=A0A0A9HBP9_ARUDO
MIPSEANTLGDDAGPQPLRHATPPARRRHRSEALEDERGRAAAKLRRALRF